MIKMNLGFVCYNGHNVCHCYAGAINSKHVIQLIRAESSSRKKLQEVKLIV